MGRLKFFKLDNYDNYVPNSKNIESAFEAKLSLKKGKKIQSESEEESEESSDSDLEVIEALLAKKYSRGRGKYKGKAPLICFSCEEIGHIAARCPNKQSKDEKKGHKYHGKKNFKSFKDKGKKTGFMAKDSDNNKDEIVYIVVKDEFFISKILRTLLPIYAIRVSAIQERRCEENHNITLHALVGRLIAFELDKCDNYVPTSKNIESTFEAKLSLKEGKKI